jgi:hypothetical protein
MEMMPMTTPPNAPISVNPPTPKIQPRRRTKQTKSTPYASATAGIRAREEVKKTLQRFGCEKVGFMDDFQKQEVLLAFVHRGRQVQLHASAKGWAAMYLKAHPYSGYRRKSRQDYEREVLDQGFVAVNSVLRDWVKGSMTAVEAGILSFEAVFLPHMLTHDGRPLIERVADLLPKPDDKVVALPAKK